LDYKTLPSSENIKKAIEALESHGIIVTYLENKESVLSILQLMIPASVTVMTGASVTLEQTGFTDLLKSGKHPWKDLKAGILSETDPIKQSVLRKQATMADYFLGSVHAITQAGEIVVASATGSQIPAYAYSASNLIWVVGAQKIVPDLDTAFHRIRDYALPMEDRHIKQLLGDKAGSLIGKILIFERDSPYTHRNLNLLLVNEVLGF
jgi:L-lactate utilization protein LutC